MVVLSERSASTGGVTAELTPHGHTKRLVVILRCDNRTVDDGQAVHYVNAFLIIVLS